MWPNPVCLHHPPSLPMGVQTVSNRGSRQAPLLPSTYIVVDHPSSQDHAGAVNLGGGCHGSRCRVWQASTARAGLCMAARQEPSTAMLPFCVKHASAQPCSRAGEGELPNGRAFQIDIGGPPWSHSAMYMYNCSAFFKCAETSRTRPARLWTRQSIFSTPSSQRNPTH